MNYIFVSSTAAESGGQGVYFGPTPATYIEYYAESAAVTPLQSQLQRHLYLAARSFDPPNPLTPPPAYHYKYTVHLPPLEVLEFLKQQSYTVVGTNTIGNSCLWTLRLTPLEGKRTQTDAATLITRSTQTDAEI